MDDAQTKTTPMMQQYLRLKREIPPDALLFFRLGDFYEMFFDDAARASKIMGLVLTKRAGIPMCGFPYHALDVQLPVALAAGVKVAIAEQTQDPKTVPSGKMVDRAISRIITPGTVVDNSLLTPERNNFLVALTRDKNLWALASLDISTGEFRATILDSDEKLTTELNKLGASECLLPDTLHRKLLEQGELPQLQHRILFTELDNWAFGFDRASEFLCKHFQAASMDAFGCRDCPLCVSAAGALLFYATENLRQDASHVNNFTLYRLDGFMEIDSISQRNLELVEPLFGDDKSSTLLAVLDDTATPMGGRLLRNWVLRPLFDHAEIVRRLDAVEMLFDDPMTAGELKETMSVVRDVERIVARVNLGSANARDLLALSASLSVIPGVKLMLESFDAPMLKAMSARLHDFDDIVKYIDSAIDDNAPAQITDGGIIRSGFDAALDELRSASADGKTWIARIQAREIERTKIKSLKIKFNNVFGYFIEVSKSFLDLVPEDYVRKQTIANGERFITPELKELENKILGAEEKSKNLELKLFQALRDFIQQRTRKIQESAEALGELDAVLSLAAAARKYNYKRPEIGDDDVLEIVGGRHPVLDAKMGADFVPNDVQLDCSNRRMMIITGPNMAGKSTYIRQTALLVIMAQLGSFVPAEKAHVGLVDRIFTRIGAADDLSRGQSTFMVEMIETANILNHATNRSLVILDEIGRGTSTFDGLSIAWSVAEFLHDDPAGRCRTQFATHYHELTELAQTRRGINNYNVAVKEYGDEVIFLRQIIPGSTDRSYGIHVAKLAGLPQPVIERAKAILESLEAHSANPRQTMQNLKLSPVRKSKKSAGEDDADLFQMRLF